MRLSCCLQLLSINAMDPSSLLLHTVTSHSNSERTSVLNDSVPVHVCSSVRTGNPHPHGNHLYQLESVVPLPESYRLLSFLKFLSSALASLSPSTGFIFERERNQEIISWSTLTLWCFHLQIRKFK